MFVWDNLEMDDDNGVTVWSDSIDSVCISLLWDKNISVLVFLSQTEAKSNWADIDSTATAWRLYFIILSASEFIFYLIQEKRKKIEKVKKKEELERKEKKYVREKREK